MPRLLTTLASLLILGVTLVTGPFISSVAAAEPPAAGESFEAASARLDGLVEQMSALREKFPTAAPADQQGIIKQHDAIVGQVQEMLPMVKAAAEREFLAAPESSEKQAQFLVAMVAHAVQSDRYEEGDRLARMLAKHNIKERGLEELAATAAFMTSDFERAEKLFAAAAADNALAQQGQSYRLAIDYYKKLWKEEQAFRAAEAKADDLPRVKLETSKGDIVLELFENEAPNTVANFISLVDKKYYDGLTFHRVLPGFMAQGGCPDGTGGGGPGYRIKCECQNEVHRKHFRGTLSMAKTPAPHTGGSQFFLCFIPTQQLDGKHTAFGRVIEGLDVLAELQRRDPSSRQAQSIKPDTIKKATVIRRRNHEYTPETLAE